MNNAENVKNVEVYLDYATIPSLNYFLHFAENYQDTETIRIFGLERFTIPESIISAYPEGIIRFFPVSIKEPEIFNDILSEFFKSTKNTKYNVCFHLNLFHSFYMVTFILGLHSAFKDRIKNIHINFYDDGAEGIASLYDLSTKLDLEEDIIAYRNQIKTSEIRVKSIKAFRYLWGDLFNCCYHLLETNYLNKKELSSLKLALQDKYKEMDLSRYFSLSDNQKAIILDILKIGPKELNFLSEASHEKNIFLFTGTTIFNYDQNRLTGIHLDILDLFINKNSECYIGHEYKLYYKGHPNSKFTNQEIKKKLSECVFLEDDIPLEILLFLGFRPKKIGGFISTSYLFFNKKDIANVIFLTDNNLEISHTQFVLSQVMRELDYIPESQIYYYKNINSLE